MRPLLLKTRSLLALLIALAAYTTPASAQKNKVDKIYTTVDKMPDFPGGSKKFGQYLAANIKYPAKARMNDVEGKVFVTFVVEKNGELDNFKVIKSVGSGCDEEAIRALKASPKWKPGMHDGKNVRAQITVPINFQLDHKAAATQKSDANIVFDQAEKTASFPGGFTQFGHYLAKTIHYPAAARDNNVEGKVVLSFVVEKDGSLSDVKVKHGIGSGCDEEAVRVLKNGPKWIPGKQNGKIVREQFVLPVTFALAKA